MKVKNFVIKAVETEDETREFTGYATTPDKDRYGDIVSKEAMEMLVGKTVPLLVDHSWSVTTTIGKAEVLEVDEKGMKIKGTFATTANSKEAYELVKMGAINKMSIGFMPIVVDVEEDVEYREIELLEISLVVVPANDNAEITEVKKYEVKKKEGKAMDQELKDVLDAMQASINEVKAIAEETKAMLEEMQGETKEKEEETKEEKALAEIKALMGKEEEK